MRIDRRWLTSGAVALLTVGAVVGPGAAVQAAVGRCVALFSGQPVQGVPGPAWLTPGTVLTYSGDVDGQPSYQQHIIVSVAGGEAIDVTTLYALPDTGGVVVGPSPTFRLPVSGSNFWVSPKGLAQCPKTASGVTAAGQIGVLRGTTTWQGGRVATAAVHTEHGLSRTEVTYDAASGLALQYTEVVLPAAQGLQGSSGMLSLQSVGSLPAPFDRNAPLPPWVRPGATLHFQVVKSVASAVTASEGLPPTNETGSVSLQVTKTSGGLAWLDVGTGSSASTEVAGGVFAGFWLPSPVVSAVKGTRTLFRDSALQERIMVGRSGGDVELYVQVGSYVAASYFSAKSGVLVKEEDNSGTTPGDPATGVPAATIHTVITLQSAE